MDRSFDVLGAKLNHISKRPRFQLVAVVCVCVSVRVQLEKQFLSLLPQRTGLTVYTPRVCGFRCLDAQRYCILVNALNNFPVLLRKRSRIPPLKVVQEIGR